MHYLVVNNNKNGLYSFAEQFQIFEDREDAIRHFVEIGGEEDSWGMGLSKKVGVASIQKAGLIDVMFMPIEVQ
jgi:hypothetical protein